MHLGYVVKRYPRFSETFIVNEILAHERAGVPVDVFAVRRVNEPYFQSILGEVRSPVHYISDSSPKAEGLWMALKTASRELPDFWARLDDMRSEEIADVLQGIHLALAAREAGVTHLHAHFATIATTVAQIAAHLAGIGFSVTTHAKDIFHKDIDRPTLRRRLAKAEAIVTVSEYNVGYLAEEYGLRAPLVTRVYNGLRLADFPYSSPAPRPPHVVAVGRLVEKKGFADLVAALALLRDRKVEFTAEIIGDGPERPALAGQVAALGLADRVRLAGALPRAQVKEALQAAAVSALPCIVAEDGDRDGLPTVLIEAMALGTPCVSTDVTGVPEIIRGGKTGLCVSQRAPGELAAAIGRLLADPRLRDDIAREARAMIEDEFDVDRNTLSLRKLLAASPGERRAPLRVAG